MAETTTSYVVKYTFVTILALGNLNALIPRPDSLKPLVVQKFPEGASLDGWKITSHDRVPNGFFSTGYQLDLERKTSPSKQAATATCTFTSKGSLYSASLQADGLDAYVSDAQTVTLRNYQNRTAHSDALLINGNGTQLRVGSIMSSVPPVEGDRIRQGMQFGQTAESLCKEMEIAAKSPSLGQEPTIRYRFAQLIVSAKL